MRHSLTITAERYIIPSQASSKLRTYRILYLTAHGDEIYPMWVSNATIWEKCVGPHEKKFDWFCSCPLFHRWSEFGTAEQHGVERHSDTFRSSHSMLLAKRCARSCPRQLLFHRAECFPIQRICATSIFTGASGGHQQRNRSFGGRISTLESSPHWRLWPIPTFTLPSSCGYTGNRRLPGFLIWKAVENGILLKCWQKVRIHSTSTCQSRHNIVILLRKAICSM